MDRTNLERDALDSPADRMAGGGVDNKQAGADVVTEVRIGQGGITFCEFTAKDVRDGVVTESELMRSRAEAALVAASSGESGGGVDRELKAVIAFARLQFDEQLGQHAAKFGENGEGERVIARAAGHDSIDGFREVVVTEAVGSTLKEMEGLINVEAGVERVEGLIRDSFVALFESMVDQNGTPRREVEKPSRLQSLGRFLKGGILRKAGL